VSRLATASFGVVIAAIVVAGIAGSTPVAAKISKAEKLALKQATVACKAEARGKKVRWLARRKFLKTCIVRSLKENPSIDVTKLIREYPNIEGLTGIKPEEWGCPSFC
jgi:hypothetical protein